MNLDKLASSTLVLSMTVSRLSKGQQKTLRKKIKQKRTKMRKKSKGKKRVRSGWLSTPVHDVTYTTIVTGNGDEARIQHPNFTPGEMPLGHHSINREGYEINPGVGYNPDQAKLEGWDINDDTIFNSEGYPIDPTLGYSPEQANNEAWHNITSDTEFTENGYPIDPDLGYSSEEATDLGWFDEMLSFGPDTAVI